MRLKLNEPRSARTAILEPRNLVGRVMQRRRPNQALDPTPRTARVNFTLGNNIESEGTWKSLV